MPSLAQPTAGESLVSSIRHTYTQCSVSWGACSIPTHGVRKAVANTVPLQWRLLYDSVRAEALSLGVCY
jgi:hypothetical protein